MRGLIIAAIVLCWPGASEANVCRSDAKPKRADTIRIGCRGYVVPGLNLRNWSGRFWPERVTAGDAKIPRFFVKARRPATAVTQLTVHETANNSMYGAAQHFRRNRLGVHFIIDRKGRISHHNDLRDVTQHDRSNDASVGIELVNWIYVPRRRPGRTVIGRWTTNAPRHYLVPTQAQVEALHKLATWLTDKRAGTRIPRRFAGIVEHDGATWFTFSYHQPVPATGIRAHGQMKLKFRGRVVGRSDGFFPTLYMWLRWNRALSPRRAYRCAKRITNGARLRRFTKWRLVIRDEDDWVWQPTTVTGILGHIACHGGRVSG